MPEQQQLSWKEAIATVLREANGPMSSSEIVEGIVQRGLRRELGATPTATVGALVYSSIKNDGALSPFARPLPGRFILRAQGVVPPEPSPAEKELIEKESSDSTSENTGVVNAFGMFWERGKVDWTTSQPRLLGKQPVSTRDVDFSSQKGVYLLHDTQGVLYVGRVTDQSLGRRLLQHTTDRLNGRWSRFSWFGVYPVKEDGTLKSDADFSRVDIDVVIVTMEAVLIEGLEPRQNRKRGDDFQAVEFLQVEDPGFDLKRKKALLDELGAGFRK